MGTRDYRWREAKKTKKGAKKVTPVSILPPQETVEVIRKPSKKKEEEESE